MCLFLTMTWISERDLAGELKGVITLEMGYQLKHDCLNETQTLITINNKISSNDKKYIKGQNPYL